MRLILDDASAETVAAVLAALPADAPVALADAPGPLPPGEMLPDDVAALYGRLRPFLVDDLGRTLDDIEWRFGQALAREAGLPGARQVTAEDLDTTQHVLTGYTVTNNSPIAGSIAWASLHIVYAGVDYTITDGNTALKYAYFVKPGSGTSATLTLSNTKPTLGPDDLLVFINNGGTAIVAGASASASLPNVVANGAVDSSAIAAGAVGTTALAGGAVTGAILATGAVGSTNIAGGAVGTAALASGAVTSTILAAGAVTATRLSILDHVLY